YALLCFRMATTTDDGATISQNTFPGGCAGEPQSDRQWYATYDPPVGLHTTSAYTGPKPLLYFVYNGTTEWTKSTDGLNWSPALAQAQGTGGCATPSCSPAFGPDGYPALDQVTGKVFEAAGSGTSLLLNIGTPDANGVLTFLDHDSSNNLIHIHDGFKGSPDNHFTVVSLDDARNLWVVAAITSTSDPLTSPPNIQPADYQIFVSVASAASGWTKWATPVMVSKAPSRVSVFPWLKAGGAGRADAVWYGTNSLDDPSSTSGQAWDVFMSQLVWPTDSHGGVLVDQKPSTQMVKVSPHPAHYDDICLKGTACIAPTPSDPQTGNRNLADFFEVNIDKTGAAEVVYNDTSNRLVQQGFNPGSNQSGDHAGGPIVTLVRQASGPGLYGYDVTGPPNTPRRSITGAADNALYSLTSTGDSLINGTNVPGLDLLGVNFDISPSTLRVNMQVADLSNPAATLAAVPGSLLQYVVRWQMGDKIYYAAMENSAANNPTYYAGPATSTDLCSVSGCEPHVIDYPEAPLGTAETGSIECPSTGTPSSKNPCTVSIDVNVADIGNPSASSLLEEIGAYSFAASQPSTTTANAQGQVDSVPMNLDGICCFNYQASYRAPGSVPAVTGVTSSPSPAATPLPLTSRVMASPWLALLWLAVVPLTLLLWGIGRRRRRT
ncbi:MAG TPA: hypothetical protein VG245_09410, partial [Candidatus Dormibacteraeota bacterium]|nr:hypothetical protein [Candidatus Dormibacteraeota bacterium]